ncbi:MAG: hypothetical protein H0T41_03990 [Rhodobacteraceae bacterium]|nr:hypothetical protein [Paracoccaceae bacterium]
MVFGSRTGPPPPIVGRPGPDVLTGTPSDDRIFGLGGDDRLTGLAGDDLLDGGTGRDTLQGGAGDDRLRGGCGDDMLFGGCGRDTLIGGKGNDLLFGGGGCDVIVFAVGFGCDRIGDFDANPQGGQDRIDLRQLGISLASFDEDVAIRDLGGDTRLSVEGHGTVLLKGVTGDDANVIDATDFILLA